MYPKWHIYVWRCDGDAIVVVVLLFPSLLFSSLLFFFVVAAVGSGPLKSAPSPSLRAPFFLLALPHSTYSSHPTPLLNRYTIWCGGLSLPSHQPPTTNPSPSLDERSKPTHPSHTHRASFLTQALSSFPSPAVLLLASSASCSICAASAASAPSSSIRTGAPALMMATCVNCGHPLGD